MRLVDPCPVPPFDASAFATYDNEEDAAPLESELVEELPERPDAGGADEVTGESPPIERPPFRGKGYLRAEAPPKTDGTDPEMSPVSAAADGAQATGVEDRAVSAEAGSSHSVSADANATTAAGSADTPGEDGEKKSDVSSRGRRRRRSRRRRRKPGETSGNGGEGTSPSQSGAAGPCGNDSATSPSGAESIETGDQFGQSTAATSAGTADGKPDSDKPTGRRRRRRSRNRGRGRGESGTTS